MKNHHRTLTRQLAVALLTWLCNGAIATVPTAGQTYPPPAGAGIAATLRADQDIYTNQPESVWCPPCVTNQPPCMLPCYAVEGKAATARFTFEVSNQYNLPRTFQFSNDQQFDVEVIDQSGRVVAAWSDDKFFTQAMTSFTLDSGQTVTFIADVPLKDREGQQLNGTYQVRAFLTTSGPQPRVEATNQTVLVFVSNR